jgi:hypothetical protein
MGGTCGTHGRGEKMYKVLVENPEGKIPLERQRRRWEDGIRKYLGEFGWEEWIQLAQDTGQWWAVVNAVMNHRALEPRSYLDLLGCDTV